MNLMDPMSSLSMDSVFRGYRCLAQKFPDVEDPLNALDSLEHFSEIHESNGERLIEIVSSQYPHPLVADILRFEIFSLAAARAESEESVPAEMLEFFSDEQWPELLVLFQPSVRRLDSSYDLPQMIAQVCNDDFDIANVEAGTRKNQILVFKKDREVVSRYMPDDEAAVFDGLLKGENVESVSSSNEMTKAANDPIGVMVNFLIKWCQEGLVIDVGVPVPEGVEYVD